MKRILMITTALTSMVAANALAQSEVSVEPGDMTMQDGSPFFLEDGDGSDVQGDDIYFVASSNQILTTNILGQTIYNGSNEEAEAIGDVNDIILTPGGSAEAIVIGVGGFLGIGEKEVAISFDNIHVIDRDGSTWLTVDAGREDLEAAPAFDRSQFEGRFATQVADNGLMDGRPIDPVQEPGLPSAPDVNVMGGNVDDNIEVGNADDAEMAQDPDAVSTASLSPVEMEALSANEIIGARAFARNDQDIGEIGDILFDEQGRISAYIVDVGGFLGIGKKPVAVAAADLDILRDQNGWLSVHTQFSKQQLQDQAVFDPDAYFNNRDSVVLH